MADPKPQNAYDMLDKAERAEVDASLAETYATALKSGNPLATEHKETFMAGQRDALAAFELLGRGDGTIVTEGNGTRRAKLGDLLVEDEIYQNGSHMLMIRKGEDFTSRYVAVDDLGEVIVYQGGGGADCYMAASIKKEINQALSGVKIDAQEASALEDKINNAPKVQGQKNLCKSA
jgi:hypothetical protein